MIEITVHEEIEGNMQFESLRPTIKTMLKELGLGKRSVSLYITDDEEIQHLNAKHRQKNSATDVLAWSYYEQDPNVDMIGELVISYDHALKQAKEHGWPVIKELKRLIAHGLAHLAGYDHEISEEEEARMLEVENRLLDSAGVKKVYSMPHENGTWQKTADIKKLYSYNNKEFLLSPEAQILRNLAESLYPSYLLNCHRKGIEVEAHPVPALDENFIASSEAIWFRVLCETIYAEIVHRRENIKHTVLVFGSARLGSVPHTKNDEEVRDYYKLTRKLTKKITEWSLKKGDSESKQPFVVCTGGGPGIMEAGNRGAIDAGGISIGLNIQLPNEQDPNPYITEELSFNFHYFFTRKFHFLRRARAAVVMPGGFGTLDELFETLTLIQTGKIDPFKIILFGRDFWQKIINMDALIEEGTISKSDLQLFEYHDTIESTLASLKKDLRNFN